MPRRFDEQFPDWPHDKLDAQKYMSRWFMGGEEVDAEIKEKFGAHVEAMRSGEHDSWKDEPMSCLAGIVLMDQFTRNAYRDTPQMCAFSTAALAHSTMNLHTLRCGQAVCIAKSARCLAM